MKKLVVAVMAVWCSSVFAGTDIEKGTTEIGGVYVSGGSMSGKGDDGSSYKIDSATARLSIAQYVLDNLAVGIGLNINYKYVNETESSTTGAFLYIKKYFAARERVKPMVGVRAGFSKNSVTHTGNTVYANVEAYSQALVGLSFFPVERAAITLAAGLTASGFEDSLINVNSSGVGAEFDVAFLF